MNKTVSVHNILGSKIVKKLASLNFSAKTMTKILILSSLVVGMVIPASLFAGAPFSNRETPVDQRGWREMWNKEANKKVPRYDKAYQEGKKIYKGTGGYDKYEFCVPKVAKDIIFKNDESFSAAFVGTLDKVELSKKTVAPYRGLSVVEFASVLYDCNDPKSLVLNKLEKEDAGLVIYYLYGRYHLRLTQEPGGGKLAKIRNPYGPF